MKKIPEINPGDLVKVYTKIREGDKERITHFQGVVVQTRGIEVSKTFTVRKISAGIGIERIFPLHSPAITKIEIKKRGKVRRAKLSYLRHRVGRKMKIKEAAVQEESTAAEIEEKAPPETVKSEKPEEEQTKDESGEGAPGQTAVEKA